MSRFAFLLAGAALLAGAPPAAADMHQLGAVNVAADHYTHVRWSHFEGPVLRLRFVAANDTVDCEHIIVTYRDGTSHDVFSGTLVRASAETITFPEGDSRIRHVDFACKAQSVDGARIALSSVSEGPRWENTSNDGHAAASGWDAVRPADLRTDENAYPQ